MSPTMSLDTFSKAIDEFLEKSHAQLLVDMPEGTQDVTIKDNTGLGSVVQFYILLKALPAVFQKFKDDLDAAQEEVFIDECLRLVKAEILEEEDHE